MANRFQIAIFNNINHGVTGKLCKWATGLADYHIGITDGVSFWDQDMLFRKRPWKPHNLSEVTLFECPVKLTVRELDQMVLDNVESLCKSPKLSNILKNIYGYFLYLDFGLIKLGINIKKNAPGVVCSGRVRDILHSKGFNYLGHPDSLEPSPADIRRMFVKLNIKIIKQGKLD